MVKRSSIKVSLVLFDTSALILSFKNHVNLLDRVSEIVNEIYIPIVTRAVLDELDKLHGFGSPQAKHMVTAIKELISRYFSIADIGGEADESIINFATQRRCTVVTCDMELKRKLEKAGVTVIYFRKSSGRFESIF